MGASRLWWKGFVEKVSFAPETDGVVDGECESIKSRRRFGRKTFRSIVG